MLTTLAPTGLLHHAANQSTIPASRKLAKSKQRHYF
jgi:hypothetical protein